MDHFPRFLDTQGLIDQDFTKLSLASSLQNSQLSTRLGSSLSAKAFALALIWMTFCLRRKKQVNVDGTVTWLLSYSSFISCLQPQKEKDTEKSVLLKLLTMCSNS
ncbi:unnamed protein product [Gadus morhua 'NCC']